MLQQGIIEELLNKAEQAYTIGDRRATGILIKQVLKRDFTNDPAWHLLHRSMGNTQKIEDFKLEFATAHYPDKVHLLLNSKPDVGLPDSEIKFQNQDHAAQPTNLTEKNLTMEASTSGPSVQQSDTARKPKYWILGAATGVMGILLLLVMCVGVVYFLTGNFQNSKVFGMWKSGFEQIVMKYANDGNQERIVENPSLVSPDKQDKDTLKLSQGNPSLSGTYVADNKSPTMDNVELTQVTLTPDVRTEIKPYLPVGMATGLWEGTWNLVDPETEVSTPTTLRLLLFRNNFYMMKFNGIYKVGTYSLSDDYSIIFSGCGWNPQIITCPDNEQIPIFTIIINSQSPSLISGDIYWEEMNIGTFDLALKIQDTSTGDHAQDNSVAWKFDASSFGYEINMLGSDKCQDNTIFHFQDDKTIENGILLDSVVLMSGPECEGSLQFWPTIIKDYAITFNEIRNIGDMMLVELSMTVDGKRIPGFKVFKKE